MVGKPFPCCVPSFLLTSISQTFLTLSGDNLAAAYAEPCRTTKLLVIGLVTYELLETGSQCTPALPKWTELVQTSSYGPYGFVAAP